MAQKDIIEKKKPQLEKVESPNFFQFKEIGDTIEGVLLEKANSDQYGFGLYTIQTDKDERIRFHGSAQLDDLMSVVNLNDYVSIKFIDVQKMPKGNMKLFEVLRGVL
jgi:hypothetical protein